MAQPSEQISREVSGAAHNDIAAAAHARVVAESVAAGDDDRIPRLFLGLADLAVLVGAFLSAHTAAPFVQRFFLPGGPLYGALPAILPVPGAPTPEFPALSGVIWLLFATAPATLVFMELLGGYRRLLGQSATRLATTILLSQGIAISFGSLIVFALKLSSSSRVLVFTYGLLSAFGLLVCRFALWLYQRHRLAEGAYAKNVLLIGQPQAVAWMTHYFRDQIPQNQFRLAGWLSTQPTPAAGSSTTAALLPLPEAPGSPEDVRLALLGSIDNLGQLLVHQPVHEVIALLSAVDRDWLNQVMESCDYFRVRLRIVPQALLAETVRDLQIVFRGDPLRLPEVVLAPPHLDSDVLVLKRLIDIAVSAALLALLAPVFLIIAAAIKVTTPRLPVFYPWRVIGLSGRPFTGYKFTTMVADADEQKQHLLARNEMEGPVFKLTSDPRITPLGRILRKFSLNELPQLWSVLKGDMSLVGPRPAFRDELERYELWHKRKLCIKPGLTCLWQVSGRNRINNFDDWVRLDLEYIDRWSLWLDMQILARTLWVVVSGSGS